MASIQADPSFEGNFNRYMDFDFTIACLFYLTWRWNILISPKDNQNYLIIWHVCFMDLLVFSILYMYKAFQYRRLALKITTAFEMHQSISSLYFCGDWAQSYFFRLNVNDEQLKNRMLMAVPKKGRLYDQCIALLDRAGVKVIWTRLNI